MSFILIDRLKHLSETQVIAEKSFSVKDPIFMDHFPGGGIVPGSLLLEGMAQSCGWWISWRGNLLEKSVLLLAEGVQFRRFVKPGEQIVFKGKALQWGDGRARFDTFAIVAEQIVAKAQLSFSVFKIDDRKGPFNGETISTWMRETFENLGGSGVENADEK